MASTTSYFRHQAVIFIAMYLGYALYSATRKSFTYVMPYIIEEREVSKSDLGLIISSQTFAYGISKFISGVFVDRLSPRLMFSFGLFFCGVANLVFPAFEAISAYALLWFVNGIAQGFGWPACGKILKQWFTPAQLGTYWSLLSTSTNVAGVLSPVVSTIIAAFYDWRLCLQIQGALAVILSFLCFFMITNSPNDVGLENVITDTGDKVKSEKGKEKGTDTMSDLLASPFMWVISILFALVFGVTTGCTDWSSLYLIQEKRMTAELASGFASALQIGAVIGSIAAGYLTDIQMAKHGIQSHGSARYPLLTSFMLLLTISLHLLVYWTDEHSPQYWLLFIGFIIGNCTFGSVSLFGVLAIEHSPTHLSGSAHAIAALGANVGGVLAGLPLSYVANDYGWSGAFLIMEITSAICLLILVLTWSMPSKIGKRLKKE